MTQVVTVTPHAPAPPVQPVAGLPEVAVSPPSRPRTILGSLKERREAALNKLYLDIPVPRWGDDIEICVRLRPVEQSELDDSLKKRQNRPNALLLTHADMLVRCCVGIYAILDDDQENKYTLDPAYGDNPPTDPKTWTRFDPALAASLALGPHEQDAVAVCRKLFLTDGDLMAAAQRLFEWSAIALEKADEDFTSPSPETQ